MKKSKIALVILSFIGLAAFGQANTITGSISSVQPYNGQYRMVVKDTSLVLLVNIGKATGTTFNVNMPYRDILIKKDGQYILNPKYANKTLKISYYMNGKGWKCIKTIE
jgi:hypothetical protein